jgi:hypothetical protein
MSRAVVSLLAFAGGVATGLLIAQYYARNKVQSGLDSALNKAGLGGGTLQNWVDSAVPIITG